MNFLIYEENLIFFLISVESPPWSLEAIHEVDNYIVRALGPLELLRFELELHVEARPEPLRLFLEQW